jgi:diaminopimelate epimerase
VVIFVEGLADLPVFEIGRQVRYHPHFEPAGTNVNFVEIKGPQSIAVRTYERGVEGETLACGTGSTASAIVSVLANRVASPVEVTTEGTEVLKIDFEHNGKKIKNVYLEGNAKIVFEGKLNL